MQPIFRRFLKPRSIWAAATAAVLFHVAFVAHSQAQTSYYWKGGTGNWDTTTANWYPQASATGAEPFVSSTTSIARIGDLGVTGTITLTTAITAQELDIDNTTGYTIAGTPALTLATGNITSNFLSGNSVTSISTTLSAPLAGTNINVSATGTGGSATSVGNDTVTLSGTNTFTGNLNLGAAASGTAGAGINRVNITAAGALPSTATVNFMNTNTSFAVTGGTLALPNNFVLNPNGGTTYAPGAFVSYIGATSGNGLTVNGKISGNGDVVFAAGINGGAGPVLLNTVNTYLGATTITNSTTGVIRLGITNALPTGTAVTFGDGSTGNSFGALDLNGHDQTVASLATNVVAGKTANGITNTVGVTTSTLTISGSATTTYASIIGIPANVANLTGASNNIALTLASTNTGTQTLSGANTYTGTTKLNGGTLLVNGDSSGATGAVTVGDGNGNNGTLGGTGKIGGATTVNTGSIITGGTNGTVGTLSFTNTLTINGTYVADVAGTGSDRLSLTGTSTAGTLTLASGSSILNLAVQGTLSATQYILASSAMLSGTFSSITGTPSGYQVDYNLIPGDVTLDSISSVPEPATWLSGFLLLATVAYSQRRHFTRLIEMSHSA